MEDQGHSLLIGHAEDQETDLVGQQKITETYFELDGKIPRDIFDMIVEHHRDRFRIGRRNRGRPTDDFCWTSEDQRQIRILIGCHVDVI